MEKIVLIGFGGHAKSVIDSLERQGKYEIYGYTEFEKMNSQYLYLGKDDILEAVFESGIKNAFVCVGYLGKGNSREKIFDKLKTIGFTLPIIVDPSAIVSENVFIDEGTFVGKGCIINSESYIGKCCIINTGSIIEHETEIDDFAHISVGSVLCGQVKVGKGAFVGANSTVIQCRKVLDYEVVPAGSTKRK